MSNSNVIHLKVKAKPPKDCGEPPLHCETCGSISFYLFKTTLVCCGCGREIQNVEVRLVCRKN